MGRQKTQRKLTWRGGDPEETALGRQKTQRKLFLIGRKFRERSLLKQGIFLFNILYKKFTKILFKPLA